MFFTTFIYMDTVPLHTYVASILAINAITPHLYIFSLFTDYTNTTNIYVCSKIACT